MRLEYLPRIWMSILMLPVLSPAASVISTNFGAGSSYNTKQGNPVGNAFDGNNYAEGDSFVLGGDAVFSSLRIAVSCFASCADAFSVALNRDIGNQPGAILETFTVPGSALGTLGANNPPIILNSTLNLTLTAGTRYWITVSAGVTDSIDWNLNATGDLTGEAISTDGGTSWFSPSGNTPGAFEVNGIIPEPGSLGLVVGAGLLLYVIGRRH